MIYLTHKDENTDSARSEILRAWKFNSQSRDVELNWSNFSLELPEDLFL